MSRYLGCLLLALAQAVEESIDGGGIVRRHGWHGYDAYEAVSAAGDLSREHAGRQRGRQVQASVTARSGRRALVSVAATPALATLEEEGEFGAPAPPAPVPASTFVSANTLTPPPGFPGFPGLLAFSSKGFVPAPVPLQATAVPQPESGKKSKHTKHKAQAPPAPTPTPTPPSQVPHRLAPSTLLLLLLFSAFLGFLVVWRQAKVLLNKPRGDFREEVAKALSRRSRRNLSSEPEPRSSHEDLQAPEPPLQATASSATSPASSGEVSQRGRDPDSLQATAKAVSGPSAGSSELEEPEELEPAEADAAGGRRRT
ncbi:hypothetical protein AK812_SmicGene32023 [Symbiodinium microadriaticum]|uniref:Uncharacterized protein n=1 Tax=Symbiodinium microadriaticum TaxID=2951 RepID=A0A1Q9CVA9_SYMMI|nr:hypothetical protein AK812_SmicGene32023 [Symbiodinium microadriaticum]CAE7654940.1 unnamed protein product [Symbiodinium sp. KB8]CAE7693343.1 unnamed protein product [Symbiodinium microadriaticum]